MRARSDLDKIARAIGAASASTEARFLDIGRRLETAVGTVTTLTHTFDALSDELKSENLQRATRDLSQIATRVAALTLAQGSDVGAFAKLAELTAAIEGRVVRMGKSVKGVSLLATNAKIAASHITNASVDFSTFATEINRTLRLAQNSLDQFAAELTGVSRQLRAAIASQSALDDYQTGAARAIPLRLERSVDAIDGHGRAAVKTAADVGRGAKRIAKRIGDAVMALQIGDITRQRIEHVDYALGLLVETPLSETGGPRPPSSGTEDEPSVGLYCRIQSAQLTDTADEFDQEVQRTLTALRELAGDAREILRLGHDAFGAQGNRQGTFLGELEEEVGEVSKLLDSFRAARTDADRIAASIADATTRLVIHISAVRSLEADIRIMGLNTTLKCDRLGTIGRPLAIIAQELRLYANEIASEANDVMTDLDQLVVIAGALSGRTQDGRAVDIASVADVMTRSLARLTTAGQTLATALATLERDGHAVAASLQETAAHTSTHEEIGRTLRSAAAELTRVTPGLDEEFAVASPQLDRLLEKIAASYTMKRERAILDRLAPGRSPRNDSALPPLSGAAPAADLDDIFF